MKLVILLFSISDFTDHFSSTNIISLSPSPTLHTDNSKLLYYYNYYINLYTLQQ